MIDNTYIEIPYGNKAKLRIRKERIIATIYDNERNRVEIFTSGTANPWHIEASNSEEVMNMIWGDN